MRSTARLARVAAVAVSLGTALTGALTVLTSAPAQASLRATGYSFTASAFGTRVTATDVSLRSDRTAWAYLGCTRMAGIQGKVTQASLDSSQTGNPLITVNGVESLKRTYSNKTRGIRAAVLSTNYVTQVVVGDAALGTPVLTIDGLRSKARTWVDTSGTFHAKTGLGLASISLTGVNTSGATQSLTDLLSAISGGTLNDLVSVLSAYPNGIDIPGLGRIYLPGSTSFRREVARAHMAQAGVKALLIVLYGQDGIQGTADDSTVVIGRAFSRIDSSPAAVFAGNAYGVSAQVAQGLVGIGKVANQPLPCQGTGGNVKSAQTAGINLLNLGYLTTGNVAGYTDGWQKRDGSAAAWAKGEVSNVTLTDGGSNTLSISAITGRVHLRQFTNGKLRAASSTLQASGIKFGDIRGTSVTGVVVNGVDQGTIVPGQTIEIPGLAKVVFGEVSPLRRGLQVIGAHIYLLSGPVANAGVADIKLGVARARISRY